MSNQTAITKLVKSISGQANILTTPRIYLDLLKNNHRAALLLSQCVYWSDKTADVDGWFFKTDAEWRDEIGMPRGGLETSLRAISKYIEGKIALVNGTPKSHYRVKLEILTQDITDHLSESSKSDLSESSKSDLLENSNSTLEETTTETIARKRERTPLQIELSEIQSTFSVASGIPEPKPNTDSEKKAIAKLWYQPIRRMKALCNGSTVEIVEAAVKKMRSDHLTVASPLSIEKVVTSIYSERSTYPVKIEALLTPEQAQAKARAARGNF